MKDLEEKFKHLEDSALIENSTNRTYENYTFYVSTSQELHAHTNQNEWIMDYGCTHHIEKDASNLSSLSGSHEEKIYVVDNYSLTIIGNGDVKSQHGRISDVYHVSIMSEIFMSISQLMKREIQDIINIISVTHL